MRFELVLHALVPIYIALISFGFGFPSISWCLAFWFLWYEKCVIIEVNENDIMYELKAQILDNLLQIEHGMVELVFMFINICSIM